MTFKSPPRVSQGMTEAQAKQVVRSGADFAVTTITGIDGKQDYWTPDGRRIRTFPNIREYVRKDKDGKVLGTGTRDANYDKGWLPRPPSDVERKLFCRWCDSWHDTKDEVDKCQTEYDRKRKLQDVLAKNEMSKEMSAKDKKIDDLTQKLDALEKLIKEKLGG